MLCSYLLTQSCLPLYDPMDGSLPGSSIHEDSPGKNTGVGCHALSRGSFQPRDWTQVSHIKRRYFTCWATRETQEYRNAYSVPIGTEKKSLVLFQGVFQTQELNLLLLYCRQILYQLNYQIDWQCCDSFGWIVNGDSEYMNMYGWVPIFFFDCCY